MSKGGSQTSTQTSQPPAYVQEAQQNLINTVKNFTQPFVSQSPTSTVAGFTPDQSLGFDLARGMAQNVFTTPQPSTMNQISQYQQYDPVQEYAQYYNPVTAGPAALMTAANAGPAALMTGADSGPANFMEAASSGPASLMERTSAGPASTINPDIGQIGGDQIRALLNPYTKDVLDPTIARMRQELGQTLNGISARNASSAAFGGSRDALQTSEANRAFGDQVALTTANLMSQGYDRATATALANAQAAQNAGTFNAGAINQMGQFNAGLANSANASNQAALNAAAEANAGRQQQASGANQAAANALLEANTGRQQQAAAANQGALNAFLEANAARQQQAAGSNQAAINAAAEADAARAQQANAGNAGAENAMRQFNSDALAKAGQFNASSRAATDQYNINSALNTASTQNTLANDELKRQTTALQQLLGIGSTEQQTAQSSLTQPTDMLKLLMQSVPNTYGQTSTSTVPTQSNPISSLAGLATIASLFFSDRRDKTDIQKLGTDPALDLPMYAYRYKGDPKGYPKIVGPMAQDVEKKYPSAVHEVGGHKVVNLQALLASA